MTLLDRRRRGLGGPGEQARHHRDRRGSGLRQAHLRRRARAASARRFRGWTLKTSSPSAALRTRPKIAALLPRVKKAVVIGGGVLGIEAAWELHQAGASVTVVESLPRIMSRQLDEGAARTLSMILGRRRASRFGTGAAYRRHRGRGQGRAGGAESPARLSRPTSWSCPPASCRTWNC